jgi:ATP sulfurylase
MKTLNLAQDISSNILKKVPAYFPAFQLKNIIHFGMEKLSAQKLTIKSAGSYLFNAVAEGVKQNLFGPDVNMEFVSLTTKVYLLTLLSVAATLPKNLIAKYSENRTSMTHTSKEEQSMSALNLCA